MVFVFKYLHRSDPKYPSEVIAGEKLAEVEEHLDDLQYLRNELRLLLNLCKASVDGCPIIDSIDRGIDE